jgi:hypothetical protein
MSPAFRDKEKRQSDNAAMEAAVNRLSSLPLPQLAGEVMTKGFLDEPRYDRLARPNLGQLIRRVVPDADQRDRDVYERLSELVGEGVQVLEHAGLVRGPVEGVSVLCYTATRLGRVALERDAVGRILGGGSL